jgi:hypothetical protein
MTDVLIVHRMISAKLGFQPGMSSKVQLYEASIFDKFFLHPICRTRMINGLFRKRQHTTLRLNSPIII